MKTLLLTIPNINCGHCVMGIKNELLDLEGIQSVEGDPSTKKITIVFDAPATEDSIKNLLADINYPAL
ncbi:MAG: heavy-metal-associated domain-containing protein [Leptolinea sp.]|nr:heavy-metal-associated domain-containing protein [Leptolinea sp.]